jgi:hypothetical protein
MRDHVRSVRELPSGGLALEPPRSLFALRVLERGLRERLASMEERVHDLLLGAREGLDDRAISEVDVLCAAIDEQRALLGDVQRTVADETARRAARRLGPKRWA